MNKVLLILLLISTQSVLTMHAADSVAVKSSPGPVLGGHLFQPLTGVPGPFIRTVSQVSVGGGTTLNLALPPIVIGDRFVIAPQGSLAIVSMVAAHEQKIKNWLSVYAAFKLVGRLGTNVTSLFYQGVNTATTFNLGWKVKVIETERFLGTLSLDLTNGNVAVIDVNQWVRGIIDSQAVISQNPLIQTKPALFTGLTARSAYAINETFGATAFIEAIYGEAIVRGGSAGVFFNAGFSLNSDLRLVTDVPLALTAGVVYRQTPSVEDSESSSSLVTGSLRFGYSGTQNFSFGLQFNGQYGDVGGEKQAFFIGGALDMRFYY
ncbi:MAG: hypothetical protein NTX15_06760 [Candidatus Kapabacteria bacterium]|nr:hypothetical protein [Candidatus Kapabacteria bacterium]